MTPQRLVCSRLLLSPGMRPVVLPAATFAPGLNAPAPVPTA